jgi:alcohol dehydrogenase (cytochrome c)
MGRMASARYGLPGTTISRPISLTGGTGNGGYYIGDQRPGDNLYTGSTRVIDVATGKIKGYFQYHPNDSWDRDLVSPPIPFDYQRNGRTVKGLVDVARDGYM